MNRKFALEKIRVEVALNGKATMEALVAYTENRISRVAFNEACQKGMRIYKHNHPDESNKI